MKLFDAEALGRRITRKRQEYGMLQKDFAASIGLSVSFYGHIERGTRVPSLPTLVLIANKLRVSVDWLLSDSLEVPYVPRASLTARELGLIRQELDDQKILEDWFPKENE